VQVGEEDINRVFGQLMDNLSEHKARIENELTIAKANEQELIRRVSKLEIQKT
jgi:hypothetical protein